MVLVLAMVGAWALSARSAFDGLTITSPGRDQGSGKVHLPVFLTYGGNPQRNIAVNMLAGTRTSFQTDNTYYIGLLPLLLVGFALFRSHNPFFYGLLLGAWALVLLSFGGWFARLVYHFPLMAYYRHIGTSTGRSVCSSCFAPGTAWSSSSRRGSERGGRGPPFAPSRTSQSPRVWPPSPWFASNYPRHSTSMRTSAPCKTP